MRVGSERHGLFAEWSATGVALTHGRYQHDVRTGLWREWDGTRRRILEGLYLDGQRGGNWNIWVDHKQVVPDYVARFDNGQPIALDATTHRYGWLTSGTDLALVGVAVFGHYAEQPGVKWGAVGGFLVAAPLIHIAERNHRWPMSFWARAVGGLGGIAVVGMYSLVDGLIQCADSNRCEEEGSGVDWKWSWNAVLLLGGIATAVAEYPLSYRSRSVPVNTLFPDVAIAPTRGGAALTLSGRF
jgi:hypothetical protein